MTAGRPDAGPGTDGHEPTSPTTSPDTEPDADSPPTQPSPDVSEVEGGKKASESETDDDSLFTADPEDEPPG